MTFNCSLKTDPVKTRAWKQRTAKPLKRSQLRRATQPMRRVSKKQVSELRRYYSLRAAFLQANPHCTWIWNGVMCGRPSTEVHHAAGRRQNLCRVEHFRPSCRPHRMAPHDHPREARAQGWSVTP